MHRTTILLPDDLKRRAASFARSRNMSLSELIRDVLEERISSRTRWKDDPLWKALEPIDVPDGPSDLAANHDYYLYDEPYPRR